MTEKEKARTTRIKEFGQNFVSLWAGILTGLVWPLKLVGTALLLTIGLAIYVSIPVAAYSIIVHGTLAAEESALTVIDKVATFAIAFVWVVLGITVVVAADRTWGWDIV